MTEETMVSGFGSFMSLNEFNKLVSTGDNDEIRRVAMDIVCRWSWVIRGTVELPFSLGNVDLIHDAQMYIEAAQGALIQSFPISPRDYPISREEAYNLIPEHVRGSFEDPLWYWSPVDWMKKAKRVGSNPFEVWLQTQETYVYYAHDPLADRRIRSIWCGYALHRSKGQGQRDIVWQATHLPIPVLTRWLILWISSVDRPDNIHGLGLGRERFLLSVEDNRSKAMQIGLMAISQEGGWPRWANNLRNLTDWEIVVGDLSTRLIYLFPGFLGISDEWATYVPVAELSSMFEATKAELITFGFDVKSISSNFIELREEQNIVESTEEPDVQANTTFAAPEVLRYSWFQYIQIWLREVKSLFARLLGNEQ